MDDRDQKDPDRKAMTGRWHFAPLPRLYRPAFVAACIGLLLSLAAAAAVARWEDRVNKVEFENAAETEAIIMQNGMNEYISRLVALRTLFESANEEITRSEFETFSNRLFEHHPGMLRVAWLPRINRKERAEYEAAAIADGVSGYRIKSVQDGGSIVTSPQRDEYFPVFYSTQPKTSPVYGMDYGAMPDRFAALQRARDNDRIVALRTSSTWKPARHRTSWSSCRSMPRARRATLSPTGDATLRVSSPASSICRCCSTPSA